MRAGRLRELVAHGSLTVSVFRPVKTEVRPKSANCTPNARRRLFLPLSYGSYPPRLSHRRHRLRKSSWFDSPVRLLEIPNSGSSIVCTLMVNKPLNWAVKKKWLVPTLLAAPPPKQYNTPRQSHSHANRLVIWWNEQLLAANVSTSFLDTSFKPYGSEKFTSLLFILFYFLFKEEKQYQVFP